MGMQKILSALNGLYGCCDLLRMFRADGFQYLLLILIFLQDLMQGRGSNSISSHHNRDRITLLNIIASDLSGSKGLLRLLFPRIATHLKDRILLVLRKGGHHLIEGLICLLHVSHRNGGKQFRILLDQVTESKEKRSCQANGEQEVPGQMPGVPQELFYTINKHMAKHQSLSSFPVISRKTSFKVGSSVTTRPKGIFFSAK